MVILLFVILISLEPRKKQHLIKLLSIGASIRLMATRNLANQLRLVVVFLPIMYKVCHTSQVSHEKKNFLLSIESWLVNRDPYNWLY